MQLSDHDLLEALDSGALFSPCRRWRYLLWRRWDPARPVCMFVGLNPSTADETVNDPTVTRCVNFAKAWGYGAMWMTNLFAYRATDPFAMRGMGDVAIGPRNNEYLIACGRQAGLVVAAWGTHGSFLGRDVQVLDLFRRTGTALNVLKTTRRGHPSHPLYLPASLTPQPWP